MTTKITISNPCIPYRRKLSACHSLSPIAWIFSREFFIQFLHKILVHKIGSIGLVCRFGMSVPICIRSHLSCLETWRSFSETYDRLFSGSHRQNSSAAAVWTFLKVHCLPPLSATDRSVSNLLCGTSFQFGLRTTAWRKVPYIDKISPLRSDSVSKGCSRMCFSYRSNLCGWCSTVLCYWFSFRNYGLMGFNQSTTL